LAAEQPHISTATRACLKTALSLSLYELGLNPQFVSVTYFS